MNLKPHFLNLFSFVNDRRIAPLISHINPNAHFRKIGISLLIFVFLLGQPLDLPAQTVIPLINNTATGQLGISVKLGNNANSFTYLLDTGSCGFLTANGSTAYWADTISGNITTETFNISYGTGSLNYTGNVAHTKVTFTDVNNQPLTVNDVRMGVITNEPYAGWNTNINNEPTPIAPERPTTNLYYGTMGAGLNKTSGSNLASVFGQIPVGSGLFQGFIIHTGGIASSTPTLTIGFTQADLDAFPIIIPMNASIGTETNDNGTSVILYPQAQTTANYTINKDSTSYSATANLIMDTGGLATHITTGDNINPPSDLKSAGQIVDGASFQTIVPTTTRPGSSVPTMGLDWTINPTGSTDYVNRVGVTLGSAAGSLNSGIALFYGYDVLFDTQHGVIGLRPVPEPSTFALVLLTIACAGAWRVFPKTYRNKKR